MLGADGVSHPGAGRCPPVEIPSTRGADTWVNGEPAVRLEVDGVLVGVAAVTVADGRVVRVHSVANPDKLHRLAVPSDLGR